MIGGILGSSSKRKVFVSTLSKEDPNWTNKAPNVFFACEIRVRVKTLTNLEHVSDARGNGKET